MSPSQTDSNEQHSVDSTVTRRRAVGAAALILMLGNFTGSFFGFVRQATVGGVFGARTGTSAFFAASIVPQMFYDLIIGAAVSAALIPVFTEVLERDGREEYWRTVSTVLSIAWAVLLAVVVILFAAAHPVMRLILIGYNQHLQGAGIDQATALARVLVLTLFFLGTSAILLAALYSLRRFTVPAFAPSLYHLGVIAGALFLAGPLGVMALAVGAVGGSVCQAAVQAVALLRQRPKIVLRIQLTPAVRRILRLYAPVAAGLLVSVAGQVIDIGFKSTLRPTSAITTMAFATTLVQFPIGIAVAALSFAILPSISSDAAFERGEQYKDTLALGIRFVLFLTIPAAVGYLALANPIFSLLFQHGKFTAADTSQGATALVGYAIQIPFVGLDQMLIFSFYARKDTMTPMLVGIAGVIIYVVSALLLKPHYHVLGLALSNTLQNSLHAMILLGLLFATVGSLPGRGVLTAVLKALGAGLAAGVCAVAASTALRDAVSPNALAGRLTIVLVPIALATVIYLAVSAALRSQELRFAWEIVRGRPA